MCSPMFYSIIENKEEILKAKRITGMLLDFFFSLWDKLWCLHKLYSCDERF